MSSRIRNILVTLVALSMTQGFIANSVFASGAGCAVRAEKATAAYKKPLKLSISQSGINRISFAPNIVTNIWGDADEYSASLSANGSEIFLTSKLEAGNNIAIAVSLAGGRIVDLILETNKGKPQIVNLNLQDEEAKQNIVQKEAEAILSAMRSGIRGKYYIKQDTREFKIPFHKGLIAKSDRIYRFGNMIGIPLLLKNGAKEQLKIDVGRAMRNLNNVFALQVDNLTLAPNMTTQAYIVIAGSN